MVNGEFWCVVLVVGGVSRYPGKAMEAEIGGTGCAIYEVENAWRQGFTPAEEDRHRFTSAPRQGGLVVPVAQLVCLEKYRAIRSAVRESMAA
jgi:hypothetical protein